MFDQSGYMTWIVLSQILWITAFAMFLFIYFPMLTKQRADGRHG